MNRGDYGVPQALPFHALMQTGVITLANAIAAGSISLNATSDGTDPTTSLGSFTYHLPTNDAYITEIDIEALIDNTTVSSKVAKITVSGNAEDYIILTNQQYTDIPASIYKSCRFMSAFYTPAGHLAQKTIGVLAGSNGGSNGDLKITTWPNSTGIIRLRSFAVDPRDVTLGLSTPTFFYTPTFLDPGRA